MSTSPTMGPRKLLSLYSPWWWFIAHHTKRRENRDWKSPPSYRGEVWFHAAQKSEPNLPALIADVLKVCPLRGRTPPMLEELELGAGHIVARGRIARVEKNTPAICLADRWAVEGQYGLVLENVEALPMPIPWKGAQGLAEVDPFGVELVRIIASCGHRLDLAAVPATAAKEMVPIIASGVPDVTLDSVVAKLIEDGQLRQEGQVLFTRAYKPEVTAADEPPKRGAKKRGPTQQSFGW